MVCMIGGAGNLPSKMPRTKSIPAIAAMTVDRRDAVFDFAGLVVHGAGFLRRQFMMMLII